MPISHELDPDKGKFHKIVEEKFYATTQRHFYPRNLKLSEDFINAFRSEYTRLIDEGQDERRLLDRVGKALRFHVQEKCGKKHKR